MSNPLHWVPFANRAEIIYLVSILPKGRQVEYEDSMKIAEMVYEQVKALPEPLAREVLDFVVFLRERADRRESRDLMDAQAATLAPVWDNPEDKVWDDA